MEGAPIQVILSPAGHKLILSCQTAEELVSLLGPGLEIYDQLQSRKPGDTATQEDPNAPICQIHGVKFVHRQGTSRTGQPYNFWSCPAKTEDGSFCKWRPEKKENGKKENGK